MIHRFPTVLVGNGPSVLDRKRGQLIDRFERVARFNNFVINGFEEYVGTRTDMWAVNEGLFDGGVRWPLERKPPQTVVLVPFQKSTEGRIWEKMQQQIRDGVALIRQETAEMMTREFGEEQWASTGALALAEFAPCVVVGFDHFSGVQHHYSDNWVFCGSHSCQKETEFFMKYERLGLVHRI